MRALRQIRADAFANDLEITDAAVTAASSEASRVSDCVRDVYSYPAVCSSVDVYSYPAVCTSDDVYSQHAHYVASAASSSAAASSEAVLPITAPATTQHVASPSAPPLLAPLSLVHVPSNKWVQQHAPLLSQLEVAPPLLTPSQRHATLSLRGIFAGRDNEPLVEQEDVHYTLPPDGGESERRAKRRAKRHREREEAAIFRLQLEAEDPGQKEKKTQLAEMSRVIRESEEQDRQDKYEHPSSPSLDPPC